MMSLVQFKNLITKFKRQVRSQIASKVSRQDPGFFVQLCTLVYTCVHMNEYIQLSHVCTCVSNGLSCAYVYLVVSHCICISNGLTCACVYLLVAHVYMYIQQSYICTSISKSLTYTCVYSTVSHVNVYIQWSHMCMCISNGLTRASLYPMVSHVHKYYVYIYSVISCLYKYPVHECPIVSHMAPIVHILEISNRLMYVDYNQPSHIYP